MASNPNSPPSEAAPERPGSRGKQTQGKGLAAVAAVGSRLGSIARRLPLSGKARIGQFARRSSPRDRPWALPEYTQPRTLLARALGLLGLAGVIFFCFLYGAAFGLAGQYLIMQFVFPLAVLALLVIWALPEARRMPLKTGERLFLLYLLAPKVWPQYLALSVLRLPLVNIERLVGGPLALIFLLSLSTSQAFRRTIAATLAADRWIALGVAAFFGLCVASIFYSKAPIESFNAVLNAALIWFMPFFLGCYFFRTPGRVRLWVYLFMATAVFVAIIGIVEAHVGHVLWRGHIPKFLEVNDPSVQLSLAGTVRLYGAGYRTESTLGNALVTSEFMSLALPFCLHYAATARTLLIRATAILACICLVDATYETHSRSGMLSLLITSLLYLFYWSYRRWRSSRSSLIAPAVLLAYPALALMSVASVFFVGRVRHLVLGSGAETSSNDARVQQWQMGIPHLLHRPWGWGLNMAGGVVDYHSPGGLLTIDSYVLSLLIDVGVVGLGIFFALFLWGIYRFGRAAFVAPQEAEELSLLAPIAIALINFLVTKTVLSEQMNHGLPFMMLAAGLVLVDRPSQAPGLALAEASEASAPKPRMVRKLVHGRPSSEPSPVPIGRPAPGG